MSEFQTKPNPSQPDRCSSIDPHDELQCGRRIHDDDQCAFDGIAWKKGSPRYVSDAEKVAALVERVRVAEAAVIEWSETAMKFSDDYHAELNKRIDAEAALARVEALVDEWDSGALRVREMLGPDPDDYSPSVASSLGDVEAIEGAVRALRAALPTAALESEDT
ncbi:MAG: hypothetical protein JWN41_1835 [Thermoleophilia bacterium]|nr:hypothetical protein [Thermoleophilia bacterium]